MVEPEEEIKEEMTELSDIGNQEEKKNQKLKDCLKDVKFPIKRGDLIQEAKKRCPPEIVKIIQDSQVEEFKNLAEVEGTIL